MLHKILLELVPSLNMELENLKQKNKELQNSYANLQVKHKELERVLERKNQEEKKVLNLLKQDFPSILDQVEKKVKGKK